MKKLFKIIFALMVIICDLEVLACAQPTEFVFVKGGVITDAEYSDVFFDGRTVTLSDFYISKYEVTQSQYSSVMTGQKVTVDGVEKALNANPSDCTATSRDYKIDAGVDHKDHPVEVVTWYDAVYYCNALSIKEGLKPCYDITVRRVDDGRIRDATVTLKTDGTGYRLPTEAEWEYAARGGAPTQPDWNYTFSGADKASGTDSYDSENAGLDSVGWYCYNNITGTSGDEIIIYKADGRGTHKVGQKKANRLGLYDMSGNVLEWCYDWYNREIESGSVSNPVGPAAPGDILRVDRGGHWGSPAHFATVYSRGYCPPQECGENIGFRVVRTAE